MNIYFILPAITKRIIGGYKIIYEYANRLSDRGYNVVIVYDCSYDIEVHKKNYRFYVIYRSLLGVVEPSWFKLNKRIKKRIVFDLKALKLHQDDIVIVTAVNTAIDFYKSELSCKHSFYFIQDYEDWNVSEQQLIESYNYPMNLIVVSKWLQNLVMEKTCRKAFYLPNAIDNKKFYLVNPVKSEKRKYITMLYHSSQRKGCQYGIELINKIHAYDNNIRFMVFGSIKRGKEIPEYVEYIEKASEQQLLSIYNATKIFVCTSLVEGFGLTGAESMACGAALVTTRTNGSNEYVIDGENALVSEPKDVLTMYNNIVYLLENEERRWEIAKKGKETIKSYTPEMAIDNLINEIHI